MNTDLQDWTAHIDSTSWFFGIGIDRYLDFPKLHNAVKDVVDIRSLLLSKYDLQEDHVITLFNEEATEDNIKGRLHKLTRELKPDDKLLIYYSGHGHLSESNRGYWISHDAKRGNPSRYISNSDVRIYLEDSPAKHILLISDSCFSGSLFQTGSMRSTRSIDELEKRASRWGLCSGRGDEEVWDGEPGQNSPFAQSILEALASNEVDGWNVSRLVEVVTEQTAAHTRQLPQGSPLSIHGHKGGQYVFRLKGSRAATSERTSTTDEKAATAANQEPATVTEHALVETETKDHKGWSLSDGQLKWSKTKESSVKQKSYSTVSRVIQGDQLKRLGRTVKWIFAAIGLLVTGIFVLPALFDNSTPDPLQLQYEMFADGISFNYIGGTPTYTFTLGVDGDVYYGGEFEEAGEFGLTFNKFFAYPGEYDLEIKDGGGQTTLKTITIPAPEDLAINAFHTTTGMNTDNLWPTDQVNVFDAGQPVYIYANMLSAIEQEVVIKWFDEESNLLFAPEIRLVEIATDDAYRIVTYQQFKDPGGYLVQMVNYNGIIVAETVFGVKEAEQIE